jgi:PPP family 3-phenylpropionic acid transporter
VFVLLYGGFGVSSPFLPRFFESRGIGPADLGLLLGLGTAVRLLSGPLAGRVADLYAARRAVLALCIAVAAAIALGLAHATSVAALFALSLADAAALAPTTTLADALALSAAEPAKGRRPAFEYGWVRGAASAAFVAGSLVAGRILETAPLAAMLWMHAALLGAAAILVRVALPAETPAPPPASVEVRPLDGVRELLAIRAFRRLLVVAALVLGSHAMHDGFAMVRWHAAGIGPATGSVLWSESVLSEVLMFFAIGPALLRRMSPRRAMALAALAGVIRWVIMANTASVAAIALVQPLHGVTFALLHLACMRSIAATVPPALAATAQSLYAAAATAVTAILSIASGRLYADFGAHGFLAMALLCAIALPLALAVGGEDAIAPGSRSS